jgi:hypothetical protein
MKLRIFFLLFILNCLIVVRSFAENKEFENYANHESQLMHDAYVRKDAKTFGEILDGLKSRYNQLSAKDQKEEGLCQFPDWRIL